MVFELPFSAVFLSCSFLFREHHVAFQPEASNFSPVEPGPVCPAGTLFGTVRSARQGKRELNSGSLKMKRKSV